MLRAGLLLIPTLTLASSAALAQPTPSGRLFDVSPDAPAKAPGAGRVAVRLEYTLAAGAAEACPGEPELRGAVAAVIGYDPFQPSAHALVRASVTKRGGAFAAVMEHRDATGRILWSRPALIDPDCRKLVGAMGLLIGGEIDPARAGTAAPQTIQAPAPAPIFVTPAAAPAANPPPPTPSRRPDLRLGARAGVTLGALPAPAAMIAIDGGVRWEHFSLSVEGRADLPVTAVVDSNAKLRASVLAGSLVPCGHLRWFVGCAVISVGALRLEGVDLAGASSGAAVYLAAGLRAGLEWPIPRLPVIALRLSADVLATMHPIRAARADEREVWRTPPFAGVLAAGLGARF